MKWIIENMKRQSEDGLVVEVAYRVVKKENGIIADKTGKVTLQGDVNSPDFTPYKDLKESQVIEWVKSNVDVQEIESIVESLFDEKLSKRSSNSFKSGLPWNIINSLFTK
jgi:hypothetical protein